MRVILTVLFSLSAICANAQGFSGRTNAIKLNFESQVINSSLPAIRWITPALEYTNSRLNEVNIEVTIKSDVAIKEITLTISDGKSNFSEKKLEIAANTPEQNYQQPIHLDDGTQTLSISVVTQTGAQVSSARVILVGSDAIADAISVDRKDYAILFATDKYDNWNDLVNPIYDANTLATELRDKYGFEVEIVENANQEDVFSKLADYSQRKYKPQDQLMIFFAGHGYFDETFGEGFVVAKNSLLNDRGKTTYISHTRLRSVINNISCQHIFLAMDVCFGGTFDPIIAGERGNESAYETTETEFLIRKLSYKTRKYLTSGGKTYVSDGIIGKHSPFALKFLQALKESGGPDRILTLSELKVYVEKLIPEPRFGGFGEDNIASDFVFIARQN